MLNHTMIESPTSSLQDESEDMDSNNHVRLTALTVRIEGNSKQQPLLWMCGTESNGDTTFMDRTFLSDPI